MINRFGKIKEKILRKDLEHRIEELEKKVFNTTDTIGFHTVEPDEHVRRWVEEFIPDEYWEGDDVN